MLPRSPAQVDAAAAVATPSPVRPTTLTRHLVDTPAAPALTEAERYKQRAEEIRQRRAAAAADADAALALVTMRRGSK